MFKHLLVPLDGSQLAEAVLPVVTHLAKVTGATVTLLHVSEHHPPHEVHGERHITNVDEAGRYLAITAQSLPAGLHITEHTHPNQENDVARSIVDHARELEIDLIVLCTHGRGNLRRWLFGSIAQKVIALGETPVLLIHPAEPTAPPTFHCHRIMTPLDGDPDHEAGLTMAVGLATACDSALHLLMVVPTLDTLSGHGSATAILLPSATRAVLDLSQQGAAEYLQAQVTRFAAAGLSITTEVRRGEPSTTIVQAARNADADLIVMATHGKSHLDAFWSGSVTPRVSGRSQRPLLLVPVHET